MKSTRKWQTFTSIVIAVLMVNLSVGFLFIDSNVAEAKSSSANSKKNTTSVKPLNTVLVTSVTLTPASVTLNPGQSRTITSTITPANATNKTLTWSTNNAAVATVDSSGKVTAVGAGTAKITAVNSASGKSANVTITVVIPVTEVKLNNFVVTLVIDETTNLIASVVPNNATNKNVTWTSSNATVATVSSTGKVTALSKGVAAITSTSVDGGKSATAIVIVDNKPIEQIFDEVSPFVGYIEAYDENDELVQTGSGFLVSGSGNFITNLHVVTNKYYPISYVNVTLGDGTTFLNVKRVIDYDYKHDLAVLRLPNVSGAKFLSLGDSTKIKTGQSVLAIGSPQDLVNTISQGIISAKNRAIGGVNYIQISVPIDQGSSGGVLLNTKGEAIGITTAGFDTYGQLNLAIPIQRYKDMALNKSINLIPLQEDYFNDLIEDFSSFEELEPNNTNGTAEVLTYTFEDAYGTFSSFTDVDVYKVTLKQTYEVSIGAQIEDGQGSLNSNTQYFRIEIYDETNTKIETSFTNLLDMYDQETFEVIGSEYLQAIGTELSAGTYYFVVKPISNSAKFNSSIQSYNIGFGFYSEPGQGSGPMTKKR